MAPFFAFTCVSVVIFIAKRTRRTVLTIPFIGFVIASWVFMVGPQIFDIGKIVALHDADSTDIFLKERLNST